MKKGLSLILALVLCLSLCACGDDAAVANPYEKYSQLFDMLEAEKYDEALDYIQNLTGTTPPSEEYYTPELVFEAADDLKSYVVTGLNGIPKSTDIVIPATYQGQPVSEIARSAFGSIAITSVVIPEGITTIGGYAFENCEKLTSVTIPKGVTTIGEYAFSGCTSLTNVIIQEGVTTIGECAFLYCTSLTNVTIPDSVNYIVDGAFSACTSLTSIVIPDSVTHISKYAFQNSANLSYNIYEGGKYLGSESNPYHFLIDVEDTKITSFQPHPDTVVIGACVFKNCANLSSIVIPQGVTTIGNFAFSYCTALATISIPDSVSYIGYESFSGCTSLTGIIIPDSVTTIGRGVFYLCSNLTSVIIPESITEFNSYALYGCDKLTDVDFTGTKAQWNTILKDPDQWNENITVHCSDGDISY